MGVATLARIRIYPVKALDPVEVSQARVVPPGTLEHDRAWALCDGSGAFVNGKRDARVHGLASEFDLARMSIRLGRRGGSMIEYSLDRQAREIEAFLGRYFAEPVELLHRPEGGFPDDGEAWGPTIVSTASLEAVCEWFPGFTIESARRRFRANLEIDGVPAFWEDRLYGAPGTTVRFRTGGVSVEGVNPCQRCVVPSRDPDTGVESPGFQKRFAELRRGSLPAWAAGERFNHYYRFTVNTRIVAAEAGKVIRVGDRVEIEGVPAT